MTPRKMYKNLNLMHRQSTAPKARKSASHVYESTQLDERLLAASVLRRHSLEAELRTSLGSALLAQKRQRGRCPCHGPTITKGGEAGELLIVWVPDNHCSLCWSIRPGCGMVSSEGSLRHDDLRVSILSHKSPVAAMSLTHV